MITAVIIDDESRAREVIKSMICMYCPNIHIVGESDSVEGGYSIVVEKKPKLVFLDIQMPDGTGFDLLKRFDPINFKFVIITAYQEYAVRAFRFSAIDYILKPLDPAELMKATEKIEETFRYEDINQQFRTFEENINSYSEQPRKIVLKTHDSILVVDTLNIVRCESRNNCTQFTFTNQEGVIVSKTLKEFEDLLTTSGFVRTHQSHLVNLSFIKHYKRFPESHIVLHDGTQIPVSIRKRDIVTMLLKDKG